MKAFTFRTAAAAALCGLMLAACGGGHTDTSTTTTTTSNDGGAMGNAASGSAASTSAESGANGASPMPGSTNPNSSGAMGDNGAMAPNASPAPVPASLTCKAGDNIVWVNSKRHVYHMASDPYYGRTKHGEYMCESAAKAKGDHMAGSGGAMQMNASSAQPSASP